MRSPAFSCNWDAPPGSRLEGAHAYAILEGHLTYNGAKLLHSHGTLTFALVKEPRGWLISAFAWTGPVATL